MRKPARSKGAIVYSPLLRAGFRTSSKTLPPILRIDKNERQKTKMKIKILSTIIFTMALFGASYSQTLDKAKLDKFFDVLAEKTRRWAETDLSIPGGAGALVIGNERFACAAGDAFFVPAKAAHHFENLSDDFATQAIFF
jgi:gentisate 1,2-dioxygenase